MFKRTTKSEGPPLTLAERFNSAAAVSAYADSDLHRVIDALEEAAEELDAVSEEAARTADDAERVWSKAGDEADFLRERIDYLYSLLND